MKLEVRVISVPRLCDIKCGFICEVKNNESARPSSLMPLGFVSKEAGRFYVHGWQSDLGKFPASVVEELLASLEASGLPEFEGQAWSRFTLEQAGAVGCEYEQGHFLWVEAMDDA